MKQWINQLFSEKNHPSFKEEGRMELTEELPNPVRGFYSLYRFLAEKEPDFSEAEAENSVSRFVMVLIDIGAYRQGEIDADGLDRIRRILGYFAERKQDMIVRVCYDHEGRAAEREPSLFSGIVGHLRQLMPIFSAYTDSIFVYQGVLVGNWGEMHGSRYLTGEHTEETLRLLRECTGEETFLAVRKPAQWRGAQRKSEEDAGLAKDRLGLFDDAILGSESDLGTFGAEPRKEAGWSTPWCREDELLFVEKLCRYVPNGGEAVYGDGFAETLSQEQLIKNLRRTRVTYLNRMHDKKLLSLWKAAVYQGKGAFAGKSLYEYISAHLGYRFSITGVSVSFLPKKNNWQETQVEIRIKNTGFAPIYQKTELELTLTEDGRTEPGAVKKQTVELLLPEEERAYRFVLLQGRGKLFLRMRRVKDGRGIYFAHPADKDGRVLLGVIQ